MTRLACLACLSACLFISSALAWTDHVLNFLQDDTDLGLEVLDQVKNSLNQFEQTKITKGILPTQSSLKAYCPYVHYQLGSECLAYAFSNACVTDADACRWLTFINGFVSSRESWIFDLK